MAEFEPFHGLRYNTKKVNLNDVLAPPYDVIKGDMRDELIARSPYNVVEVELPAGSDEEKYQNAARILETWKNEGILVRDEAEFYLYEQEFTVPGTNTVKKRRGVLGQLLLEEFGKGVQPHEHTLSGPKQDRLNLLRATRTNTSPIFGLFADSDGWVASLLNNATNGHVLCEARDGDGIIHRLWHIDDDETVNALVAALEDEPILIADGHHRYETALNYRNEARHAAETYGREWTGDEPENYVLMMCVATSDEGLIVLPTHRVVKAEANQLTTLLEKLGEFFDITEAPTGDAANIVAQLDASDLNVPGSLGLHIKGASYLLQLKPGKAHHAAMDQQKSEAYRDLDVSILHSLILERELGIDAEKLAAGGHVAYTIDAAEAIKKVESGQGDAAFILRSTPVDQVQKVAEAGDKMPQKSTYFYPKLVTGMVLRPLD